MAKTADAREGSELTRLEGVNPSEALIRWKDAAGLTSLKPGACFTAADDRLFALGWPNVRFVSLEHRDERDPPVAAGRLLGGSALPRTWTWGHRTAERFVRALGASSIFEISPMSKELRPEALEALWTEAPLEPGEVAGLLSARMGGDVAGVPEGAMGTFVLLLEALVGTEVVASAIVELLEAMGPGMLLAGVSGPAAITWQLGFLLLRLPVGVATNVRERLHGVLESVWAQYPHTRAGFSGHSHARSLHLILGGGAAAERSSDRSPRWYVFTADDPALVRRRVAVNRGPWPLDARVAWLGGAQVLRHFLRDWSKLRSADDQLWFVRQVAPLKAPEMLPLMLELATRSQVRAEAQAWFAAHREFAEPFLVESAKTGAEADAALRSMRKGGGDAETAA